MSGQNFTKRTCTCGELQAKDHNRNVVLNGWVQRRRDLGGLIFIDLRDRYGLTQVVFNPQDDATLFTRAEKLRSEYVISVEGMVRKRPEGSENRHITTGDVEVIARNLEILNTSKTPPFVIADDINVDENLRLKYRYLDIRRPKVLNNFILRHRMIKAIRDFLDKKGFLEIETPILVKATPEGARDFLVPSRLSPGKFYALPQSPQLLKQILMVAGVDKYFQIARCFRDEDLRADRQPEFSQVDFEMSFVEQEDVLRLMEEMVSYIFSSVLNIELKTPFPRMTYSEATNRFGSDKPDTRFGMELIDITDIAKNTEFGVFKTVTEKGGVVKGINLPSCADFSRKKLDELTEMAKRMGAQGLITLARKTDGTVKSPISKGTTDEQMAQVMEKLGMKQGDLALIMAGQWKQVITILGRLRLAMGEELNLIDKNRHDFLFVLDFPMFAYNEEEQRIEAEHHAFTSPKPEDMHLLKTDPLKVRASSYDMVYNGNETASGSIRIHDRELQTDILQAIGLPLEEARNRFGFLLSAFEYGAPPHGGAALGIDRIIAEVAGEDSIREVIAFPKTTGGDCLLTDAPVEVPEDQTDILGIRLKPQPEKE